MSPSGTFTARIAVCIAREPCPQKNYHQLVARTLSHLDQLSTLFHQVLKISHKTHVWLKVMRIKNNAGRGIESDEVKDNVWVNACCWGDRCHQVFGLRHRLLPIVCI